MYFPIVPPPNKPPPWAQPIELGASVWLRRWVVCAAQPPSDVRSCGPMLSCPPMPELPEVETVVRGLRATLPGRRILSVRLGKTDFIDDPASLGEQLPGRKILAVERVGKFIRIDLLAAMANGSPAGQSAADLHFLVHL